ncbi:hypothetical protein [Vibrio sp. 10N.261.51.F12]|uniref:hypothetical protein n=1 Tax=Vibrio sp. 10N.261.51.F12 TaxID=3229679 RepID=UPI00354C5876
MNGLSAATLLVSTRLVIPTTLMILTGFLAGCQPQGTQEPLPESYGLDNVDILVNQKILIPQKLTDKDYKFKAGVADLNNDGNSEIMVLMQDSYFCGSGGCNAYIFDAKGHQISAMTVTREPILRSDRRSNGWSDILVWSDGALRTMEYDGQSYPSNPSVQKEFDRSVEQEIAQKNAEIQEIYVQDGYDLSFVEEVPILSFSHRYQFVFKHYGDPEHDYLLTVNMRTGESTLDTVRLKNTQDGALEASYID